MKRFKEKTLRLQDLPGREALGDESMEELQDELAQCKRELAMSKARVEKSEAEQQRLRDAFRLLSHDLRAPVRAIAQLAEWVHDDCVDSLSGEVAENLRMLQSRALRLEQMHRDLSAYVRCEQIAFEGVSKFSLQSLIMQVWQRVSEGNEGEFEFVMQLDEGVNVLTANAHLIETLLEQLLSNALQHHDRGEGFVSVMSCLEDDGKRLVLRVDDDGPGIPLHLHQQALEPMKTLRARDRGAGTGVGLAIVRDLLRAVDGHLEMEYTFPQSSRGLRVTCEVPFGQVTHES